MKETGIIGFNELIDKSLDQVLDECGISYDHKDLGSVGTVGITRYSYMRDGHKRVAYETSEMYDCDSTVSRSIVCSGMFNDETPMDVYRAITEASNRR